MKKIIVLVIINIVCIGLCYDLYKYNISLNHIDFALIIMLSFMSVIMVLLIFFLIWHVLNYWKSVKYLIRTFYMNVPLNEYEAKYYIVALYAKYKFISGMREVGLNKKYKVKIVRKCYL